MEQSTRKNGLINLLTLLAAGAATFAVARQANSLAGQAGAAFLGLGVLVAFVSWFQMRLEESERLEKMELDEIARSRGSATLFEGKEETFPAQQSRRQFERFFVPAFTILLLLLEAGGAYVLWRSLHKLTVLPLQNPLVAMGLWGLFFLVLFLLGKYSAGIAKLEDHRLLRSGAGWLLLGAYVCLLVTAGVAAEQAGLPKVDFYLAQIFCGLLALIALETLVNLVLEIYRPRVEGKVARPIYESRLVGLLAHPEGLFTTAAHALDYQFGFKVSETWVYQTLSDKLPGFVLGLVAAAVLSSTVVFLEPGEQALLERFGRPVNGGTVLGPGPHFKWPWPIDKIYRYNTGEVQSFNVGFVPDPARANEKTILWTVSHYKEEHNLLVASRDRQLLTATNRPGEQAVPVNLIAASIPVQFHITNTPAWAYHHQNARVLLEQLGTREIVRYLVGVDFLDIMSVNLEPAARELRERIQSRADELGLGVEILLVGLQGIHPPVPVAGEFEAVNGAAQEVEAKILKAEGETNKTILLAQAEAQEKVRVAEGEALRRVSGSVAQAARFTNQIAAYQAAPEVYPTRLYLQTLARAIAGARKYIVGPTNTQNVVQIDLQDKLRPDLLDVELPSK
jgi:modulator of FtsH protease HflK